MSRGTHDEDSPDGALCNRLVRGAITGVEAPLEADLDEDPSVGNIFEHAVQGREVEGNRFLAEGREACVGREP